MAYQITKGWPSQAAIDEIITLATEGTVVPGMFGIIEADGEAAPGTYPLTAGVTSLLPVFFCIDEDKITQKVTGLMSDCMIVLDSDHYVAGSFAPGQNLSLGATTETAGKLEIIADSGDARPCVAKVISYSATPGKLKVLFVGSIISTYTVTVEADP